MDTTLEKTDNIITREVTAKLPDDTGQDDTGQDVQDHTGQDDDTGTGQDDDTGYVPPSYEFTDDQIAAGRQWLIDQHGASYTKPLSAIDASFIADVIGTSQSYLECLDTPDEAAAYDVQTAAYRRMYDAIRAWHADQRLSPLERHIEKISKLPKRAVLADLVLRLDKANENAGAANENTTTTEPRDPEHDEPTGEFTLEVSGSRKGQPYASQHNIGVALRKLNVTLTYDRFARRKLIKRGTTQTEIIADSHVEALWLEIDRSFGFRPGLDFFRTVINVRARENSFHPVLDYLKGLVWDEVPRCETWLIDFGGAPDTPYVRAVSKLILVAAVRRVRQPGCKFDEMLILESPQGLGKSLGIRALAGPWFGDSLAFGTTLQRQMEATAGKWIVEAGELRGISKSEDAEIKQYLSKQVDEQRMAFERETSIVPRHFVIIGTTNDPQYLKDKTGGRRYWPVKISGLDVAKLADTRDQLWAEAAALEAQAQGDIRLDPKLWAAAGAEQESRRHVEPTEILLTDAFADFQYGMIKLSDVWKLVGVDLVSKKKPSNTESGEINAVMMKLGWEQGDSTEFPDKKKSRTWVKGTVDQRKVALTIRDGSTVELWAPQQRNDATTVPVEG